MMPGEQARLLALLDQAGEWRRSAGALDARGNGIVVVDAAVVWDIWCAVSAVRQAKTRRREGRDGGAPELDDRLDPTIALLREQTETIPVWQGKGNSRGSGVIREGRRTTPSKRDLLSRGVHPANS